MNKYWRIGLTLLLVVQACSSLFSETFQPSADVLTTKVEPSDVTSMPQIGNGYVSTLVDNNVVYMACVFNGRDWHTPSHRAAIPATLSIIVTNGNLIGAALNLRNATYSRQVSVSDPNGECTLEQRLYANRRYSRLVMHEIAYNCSASGVQLHLAVNTSASPDILFERTPFDLRGFEVQSGKILITETSSSQQIEVAYASTIVQQNVTLNAKQGVLRFMTVYASTLDAVDPVSSVVELYRLYGNMSSDALFLPHVKQWDSIWTSGLEIEGNVSLASSVNASLYDIYSSASFNEDVTCGLSPGSLALNSYNGHSFWDTEIWMLPTFTILNPTMTKNVLRYRLHRISAAKQKALKYGHQGIMFPWESAFTGVECCPQPTHNPEGIKEQHITSDIAIAFQHYLWATKQNWTEALEVIDLAAQFWSSRVYYNETLKKYTVLSIVPPDEMAGIVDSDCFTNAAAAIVLQFAITNAKKMGKQYPPIWSNISTQMYIPYDSYYNFHPEYQGYNGSIIKQCDVVLMQYPLSIKFNRTTALNDIYFYSNRTEANGPFMSQSIYCIALLQLNESDSAAQQFNAAFNYVQGPFKVFYETIEGGSPHFLTGSGSFLQSITFGYLGLRIYSDYLEVNPYLPKLGVTRIGGRQLWLYNVAFDLSYNGNNLTISNPSVSDALLIETKQGTKLTLKTSLTIDNSQLPVKIYQNTK